MKIKHKLLADYQYTSSDKKIFLIKSGTIIEEYLYKLKGENIPIDKDIVEANPQLFDPIDWKAELLSYMKSEKMPQPAQLSKKLFPFIEDMILSSLPKNDNNIDTSMLKELDNREFEVSSKIREIERKSLDLDSRDRRINDKEEEIDIRLSRLEKREDHNRSEISNLDKKEDDLRIRSKEIILREEEIKDLLQEVKEKERNIDRNLLTSSLEIDSKYAEIQLKIDRDIKSLSERERELNDRTQELNIKEESISKLSTDIEERLKSISDREEKIGDKEDLLLKKESELGRKFSELNDWEQKLIAINDNLNRAVMPR